MVPGTAHSTSSLTNRYHPTVIRCVISRNAGQAAMFPVRETYVAPVFGDPCSRSSLSFRNHALRLQMYQGGNGWDSWFYCCLGRVGLKNLWMTSGEMDLGVVHRLKDAAAMDPKNQIFAT